MPTRFHITWPRRLWISSGLFVLLGFVEFGSVGAEAGHLDLVAEVVLHGVGSTK